MLQPYSRDEQLARLGAQLERARGSAPSPKVGPEFLVSSGAEVQRRALIPGLLDVIVEERRVQWECLHGERERLLEGGIDPCNFVFTAAAGRGGLVQNFQRRLAPGIICMMRGVS